MKKDEFKSGEIIKHFGNLGTLVFWSDEMRFLASGTKSPKLEYLPVVTPDNVSSTSMEEKIIHLKMECRHGDVKAHYMIRDGEYIIFEVFHKVLKETYYFIHLNFKQNSAAYMSFDSALIGLMTWKYQGIGSQAGIMFERMLQMDQEKEGQ